MMMPFLREADVVVFDLDDTLYKEIGYLYSAYEEIAARLNLDVEAMKAAYHRGENVFQQIVDNSDGQITMNDLFGIYRHHVPHITLSSQVAAFLKAMKAAGKTLGLITDGRAIMQRNKIVSLGLDGYIASDHIVISEEFGSSKPSEANYLYFHKLHPEARFGYIADNVTKDFVAPNRLGWATACLLDDGNNIHEQTFDAPTEYLPQHWFSQWEELLGE